MSVWFCLASGPSQRQEDIDAVRGRGTVVAINNQLFAAPWADIQYSCDSSWYEEYTKVDLHPEKAAIIAAFRGEKISVDPRSMHFGARIWKLGSGDGLGRDGVLNSGCNSGYQVMNLAWHRGARVIVLLGYDMQHTDGKHHNHPDHPRGMGNFSNGMPGLCQRKFPRLAADLAAEGVRVINCSRRTALRCFEQMPLSAALAVLDPAPAG